MTGETLRLIILLVVITGCISDEDAEYVFKLQITDLKSTELDIIFLIDGSSSVGEENFGLEIGFVRKLLSDFEVAENGTGVSVVVYGNHAVVYEHSEKCELLNSVLEGVRYPGGGTNTLGAFLAARELIASKNRSGRRKVAVFLITDGFSNGGDPLPIANEIKNNYDSTIFTIGIRTGNARELQRIASSTSTSYLMESFQEFDLLARKALHTDLKDGDYIPVDPSKCERCDSSAACTCGTTSGQYVCRCRPGYYGTGKPSECHPCPKSTFWNSHSGICSPCPDPNHITNPSIPATNPNDCFCKSGYRKIPLTNRCEVITCPKLTPPENGYFVGVENCPNVMNAACGVRCNVGYSLKGNSIRVCRSNGHWDGIPPNCHLKTCPKPPIPQEGSLECLNPDLDIKYTTLPDEMPVDTECTFNCFKGHSLVGSQKRTCLPVAQWDGLTTKCKPLRCARLFDIPHGRVKPETCSKTKQFHGSKCYITCNPGFIGPKEVECITKGRHGTWSSKPKCIDIQPPRIKCPRDLETTVNKGSHFGVISWDEPVVFDNSRVNSTVWWEPSMVNENLQEPHRFEIGTTIITYNAVDPSGNRATCNFSVTVIDNEPPVFENCEDPPIYLVGGPGVEITWDKPVAFDNSGDEVTVIESHEYGVLPEGVTTVTYTAFDRYNNSETCVMNITVQISTCEAEMPTGNCSETPEGMQCVMTCEEGYAFPVIDEAVCENQRPRWQIPDCTPTEIPQEISGTLPHPDLCHTLIEKCSGNNCEVIECNINHRTKRAIGQNRTTRFRLRPTSVNLPKDVIKITGESNLRPVCREGTVPMKYRCAKCPKGTYHNISAGKCEPCGIDSYNDVIGSTRCFSCPRGKATRGRKGSKSISACKRKIPSIRHEPCKNDSCYYGKCIPVGKLRHRCVCSKGWIGAKCRIPEVNYCMTKPCLNGGTCLSRRNGYTCRCPAGFGGDDCDAEIQEPQEEKLPPENICRKIEGLCENNGSCYSLGSGYRCACRLGYIGRRCQFVPCDYRPCPDATVCTNTPPSGLKTTRKDYKCDCPEGRTGYPKCLQFIDKCGGCKNNGTCSEGICLCPKSWYGPKCEQKFSPDYTAEFLKPSVSDYITLKAPTEDLTSLTLCSWVKTNNTSNYGTIFSYATEESDNTLTLLDYSGLVIWINGQYEVTRIRFSDGIWHHICLQWTSMDGSYKVYLDHRLKASGRGFSTGKPIKGGGTLVIGQEQDSPGGGFSRIESFVGEICYVDIWRRVIGTEETDCGGYKGGDWVSWAEFRKGLKGGVNILPNNFCKGCTKPEGSIPGGTIQVSGSYLTLNCQKGYRVVTEGRSPSNNPMLTRECQASGRWEDEDIPWRCARVQCNQPPRIPHGRLTTKRKRIYKYGDEVKYHCLEGFEVQGNTTKTCLETGEWDENLLECIGNHCLPFRVPDDLNLTIISEHVYDEDFRDIKRFESGTVIEVTCKDKVSLMVCLENQTWYGEFPECEGVVGNVAENEGKPGGINLEDGIFLGRDETGKGVQEVISTIGNDSLPNTMEMKKDVSRTDEGAGLSRGEESNSSSVGLESGRKESKTYEGSESGRNESKTDEGSKTGKETSKSGEDDSKTGEESSKADEGASKAGNTGDFKPKNVVDSSNKSGGDKTTGEGISITGVEAPEGNKSGEGASEITQAGLESNTTGNGELKTDSTDVESKTDNTTTSAREDVRKTGGGYPKTGEERSKTDETRNEGSNITNATSQTNIGLRIDTADLEGSKTGRNDSKTGEEVSKPGQEGPTIGTTGKEVQKIVNATSEVDDDLKNSTTTPDVPKVSEGVSKTDEEIPNTGEKGSISSGVGSKIDNTTSETNMEKEIGSVNSGIDREGSKTGKEGETGDLKTGIDYLSRPTEKEVNITGEEGSKTGEEDSKVGEEDSKTGEEDSKAGGVDSKAGKEYPKAGGVDFKGGNDIEVTTEVIPKEGLQKPKVPIEKSEVKNETTSDDAKTDDTPEEVMVKNESLGMLPPLTEMENVPKHDEVKNETIPILLEETTESTSIKRSCRGSGIPPAPDNGYFTDINFDNNTEYEGDIEIGYKCRTGYILQGQNFSKCLENGTWSIPKVSCEPIRCPNPPVHQNMLPKNVPGVGAYVFGNMVYYECDPGFSFYGNNVARCLANGRWSRLRGKCARLSCGKPTVPAADEVIIGSSYLYNDTLRVMCPKSSPRESYEARCTHTGQWLYLGNCHQEPGRR